MSAKWTLLTWAWVFLFLVSGRSQAADTLRASSKNVPNHRVILRISDAFLNSAMGREEINRQADVREVILGTSIHGKARIVGKPGVDLIESADDAKFHVLLEGTATSRTVGYNGPAIIHSRSVTHFTATREIVFEAGKGFYGLPSSVSAKTETFVEGIGSSRRGVLGRVVSRRARKIEAARHDEATEIARQKAERRIQVAFDKSSDQRIARLNEMADLRAFAIAALSATSDEKPKYRCCTTSKYIQIASSFGESSGPIELPDTRETVGAPMELWIHESLWKGPLPTGSDQIATNSKFDEAVSSFAAAAQKLGSSLVVPTAIRSALGNQLKVQKVEDWRVIQLDTQPASN